MASNVTASQSTLAQKVAAAAQKYGLNPAAFVGQIAHESGNFDPRVIAGVKRSSAGAVGIAQFMPATAKELGVDPLNVDQAIDGAARYMAQLAKQFGGDESLARKAYNWGPGNLRAFLQGKRKMPKETTDYEGHVSKAAVRFGGQPLPEGVKPSQAGAGRGAVNPPEAKAAAATTATAGLSEEDIAGIIAQSVDSGVDADSLQAAFADVPAVDTTPADQGSWQDALASLSAGQDGGLALQGGDYMEALQNAVGTEQDNTLSAMFTDQVGERPDTRVLPAAVGRYIDKVLAAG